MIQIRPASCSDSLLLAWLFISISIQIGLGTYNLISILFVLVAAYIFVLASRLRLRQSDSISTIGSLTNVVCFSILINFLRPPLLYPNNYWFSGFYFFWLSILAIGLFVNMHPALRNNVQRSRKIQYGTLLFGISAGFVLRLLLPIASPSPEIDTFVMFQESAAHLLDGLNPFSTPISDIYAGQYDFGYDIAGYAYPPLNIYFQTLSYFIFGDIRFAYIAAEVIVASCLYWLPTDKQKARLIILLYLLMPRDLFILEQAWTEPLILAAYGLLVLLIKAKARKVYIAILFGLLISLKQYLLPLFLHGFMLKPNYRQVAFGALAFIIPSIPFLIWDANSVFTNGFIFQFSIPFRSDGLTIGSAIYAITGLKTSKLITAIVGVGVMIFTYFRFKPLAEEGWQWATILTLLFIFLFGSQAFCNYYYLITGMLLFLVAQILSDEKAIQNN